MILSVIRHVKLARISILKMAHAKKHVFGKLLICQHEILNKTKTLTIDKKVRKIAYSNYSIDVYMFVIISCYF